MNQHNHRRQVEEAIADPTKVYGSPMAVVEDRSLQREEKLEVLRSWVRDEELLSAAQAENMAGGEEAHVRRAKLALAKLESSAAGTGGGR